MASHIIGPWPESETKMKLHSPGQDVALAQKALAKQALRVIALRVICFYMISNVNFHMILETRCNISGSGASSAHTHIKVGLNQF